MANKDYYQLLGLEKNASRDEIKRAFTRLAHRYHPDKKGGDEAKFKEINEAYQVLSDDTKRQQYDQVGTGGFDGFDFSNFTGANGEGGAQFDFGDIFGEMFGGGRARQANRRGRDISVDIQLTFAEAVFGIERQLLITKIGACESCAGKGAVLGSALKTCQVCAGKGRLRETRRSFLGNFTTERECEHCLGSGQVPETPCPICRGAGVVRRAEAVKITVPAGLENGEMIRLTGRGEAVKNGSPGDLYVRVHVEKHPLFRREGANLTMDLNIKLTDALLGATYPVTTLDDVLNLKVPEGVSHGEILRVRSKGVPMRGGKRGDLLIRLVTKTPTKLSKKAKNLVEELRKEGI